MTWIEVGESPDRERVSGPVTLSAQLALPCERTRAPRHYDGTNAVLLGRRQGEDVAPGAWASLGLRIDFAWAALGFPRLAMRQAIHPRRERWHYKGVVKGAVQQIVIFSSDPVCTGGYVLKHCPDRATEPIRYQKDAPKRARDLRLSSGPTRNMKRLHKTGVTGVYGV